MKYLFITSLKEVKPRKNPCKCCYNQCHSQYPQHHTIWNTCFIYSPHFTQKQFLIYFCHRYYKYAVSRRLKVHCLHITFFIIYIYCIILLNIFPAIRNASEHNFLLFQIFSLYKLYIRFSIFIIPKNHCCLIYFQIGRIGRKYP